MALQIDFGNFRCPSCGEILKKTYQNETRPNEICCGNCNTPISFVVMGGGAYPGTGGSGGSGGNQVPQIFKCS